MQDAIAWFILGFGALLIYSGWTGKPISGILKGIFG